MSGDFEAHLREFRQRNIEATRLEHEASKVLQPSNILLASIAISLKRIADSLEIIGKKI